MEATTLYDSDTEYRELLEQARKNSPMGRLHQAIADQEQNEALNQLAMVDRDMGVLRREVNAPTTTTSKMLENSINQASWGGATVLAESLEFELEDLWQRYSVIRKLERDRGK